MRARANVFLQFALIGVVIALTWNSSYAQQSVNYQLTPAHTGAIDFPGGIELPFRKIWSRRLQGLVYLPVIADGKVFATFANDSTGPYGSNLIALDAATGATLWRRSISGTYYWSAATYDSGRLFVLNYNGLLRAFDAETGARLWEKQLPVQYSFNAPPTVSGGRLYIVGGGIGGTVYAVDSVRGDIVWSQDILWGGSFGPPTLSSDGLFVQTSCRVYHFDAATGELRWTYQCSSGDSDTTVYYADRLFVRRYNVSGNSYDAFVYGGLDGTELGTMKDSLAPPAFRGGMGYFSTYSGLTARSVSTGDIQWKFESFGRLALPPVVINGRVILIFPRGHLVVLDGKSGQELQRMRVGAQVPITANNAKVGIAAGEGLLIVPAGELLIALKDASR